MKRVIVGKKRSHEGTPATPPNELVQRVTESQPSDPAPHKQVLERLKAVLAGAEGEVYIRHDGAVPGKHLAKRRLDHNEHPVRKRILEFCHHHVWRKIRITPERAVQWLLNSAALSKATGRRFNRPIWAPQVREVAALIRKGKFPHDSTDSIAISFSGDWDWGYVIFNGQHRIAAIVLADKTVTTWAWADLPLPRKEAGREYERPDDLDWIGRINEAEPDPKWSPFWGMHPGKPPKKTCQRDHPI
jgi:hypothetical protein